MSEKPHFVLTSYPPRENSQMEIVLFCCFDFNISTRRRGGEIRLKSISDEIRWEMQ